MARSGFGAGHRRLRAVSVSSCCRTGQVAGPAGSDRPGRPTNRTTGCCCSSSSGTDRRRSGRTRGRIEPRWRQVHSGWRKRASPRRSAELRRSRQRRPHGRAFVVRRWLWITTWILSLCGERLPTIPLIAFFVRGPPPLTGRDQLGRRCFAGTLTNGAAAARLHSCALVQKGHGGCLPSGKNQTAVLGASP